eukprot:gene24875-biopygen13487
MERERDFKPSPSPPHPSPRWTPSSLSQGSAGRRAAARPLRLLRLRLHAVPRHDVLRRVPHGRPAGRCIKSAELERMPPTPVRHFNGNGEMQRHHGMPYKQRYRTSTTTVQSTAAVEEMVGTGIDFYGISLGVLNTSPSSDFSLMYSAVSKKNEQCINKSPADFRIFRVYGELFSRPRRGRVKKTPQPAGADWSEQIWAQIAAPQAPPKGETSGNVAPQAPPGLATGLQHAHSPHGHSRQQPLAAFDTWPGPAFDGPNCW